MIYDEPHIMNQIEGGLVIVVLLSSHSKIIELQIFKLQSTEQRVLLEIKQNIYVLKTW